MTRRSCGRWRSWCFPSHAPTPPSGVGWAYLVIFQRDVTNCAFTATTSDFWAGVTGTELFNSQTVRVITMDPTDLTFLAMPFHLIVVCPKK